MRDSPKENWSSYRRRSRVEKAKHFLPPVPAMPAGQLGPPAAFSAGQRSGGRTDAIYYLGGGP
jgi:hypothetical protein